MALYNLLKMYIWGMQMIQNKTSYILKRKQYVQHP